MYTTSTGVTEVTAGNGTPVATVVPALGGKLRLGLVRVRVHEKSMLHDGIG